MAKITSTQVKHIAKLAHLEIDNRQSVAFKKAFRETLQVIDNLQSVKVEGAEPTHQVTGLENIWRDDEVDESSMLSQKEALRNAKNVYQGYFVVPRLIDQDE